MMNAVVARAVLRLVVLGLEALRVADPGTFENFLGDVTLEPLFLLIISESWYWVDQKLKNKA